MVNMAIVGMGIALGFGVRRRQRNGHCQGEPREGPASHATPEIETGRGWGTTIRLRALEFHIITAGTRSVADVLVRPNRLVRSEHHSRLLVQLERILQASELRERHLEARP